jgi:hypothetical protein
MTDLTTETAWTPVRTAVLPSPADRGNLIVALDVKQTFRSKWGFLAPNVMAGFTADPGVLKYRYVDVDAQEWVEDLTAPLGDEWTELGHDNIQVRRSPTTPDAVETRQPAVRG